MSESEAAGKLTKIPGIVEAAAMMPVQSVGVPRLLAKGFSTGDLDIVELSMAKKPTRQSIRNMLEVLSFDIVSMHSPKPNHLSRFLTGFKYFAIVFDIAQ